VLTSLVGRPVLDGTGLIGRYDLELTWAPPEAGRLATGVPAVGVEGAYVLTALNEQLGFELVDATAPANAFVVEYVERPEPN
jgi:uncharacterized protein (TIGR03435 family)